MLKEIDAQALLPEDPDEIEAAERPLLASGTFATGMRSLEERGLLESLHLAGTPILDTRFGVHLLTRCTL